MDDLNRLMELAGVDSIKLDEIVSKEELVDLDDVARRLQHCKKALAIANTLPDAADRKKWKGAALANLNRVRAALYNIVKDLVSEINQDQKVH
jgi:ribosomal protein L12E/L44/L45/RPP1/RPP2